MYIDTHIDHRSTVLEPQTSSSCELVWQIPCHSWSNYFSVVVHVVDALLQTLPASVNRVLWLVQRPLPKLALGNYKSMNLSYPDQPDLQGKI